MVCAIKTSIECAPLMLPIKGVCKHNTVESFSRQPRFKERQFCIWASNGILLIIVLVTMWNFKVLATDSCPSHTVQCFLMISDQLFSICGIIVVGCHSLKWRQWIALQNGWCDIVERKRDFGISLLLPPSFCQKFTLQATVIKVTLYLFYFTWSMFVFILPFFTKAGFEHSFLLNKVTVIFSTLAQILTAFINGNQFIIMKILTKSAHKQLLVALKHPSSYGIRDLEEFLRKYIKFFFRIKYVFNMLSSILHPGLILWLMFLVANMIVNLYLLIIPWEDTFFWQIITLELRSFLLTIILGYAIALADTEHIVSIVIYN